MGHLCGAVTAHCHFVHLTALGVKIRGVNLVREYYVHGGGRKVLSTWRRLRARNEAPVVAGRTSRRRIRTVFIVIIIIIIIITTWGIKNNYNNMDEVTIYFISELGLKISEYSGDPCDSRYFFQRVIVLIQRYNSILFRETFPAEDENDT